MTQGPRLTYFSGQNGEHAIHDERLSAPIREPNKRPLAERRDFLREKAVLTRKKNDELAEMDDGLCARSIRLA